MSQHIKALQEKRNKLISDAAALLQASEVTVESRASANQMLADVTVLEGDIASLKMIAKMQSDAENEERSFERSPRPTPAAASGDFASLPIEERKKKFNAVFKQYARYGMHTLNAEQRDLLTTSDATGGALIPQEFMGVLFEAKKFYGPVADRVAQKVTDNKGVPMKISYSNDTANGITLVATEGTSGPAETYPTFVSKILGVDTVTGGLVKISFQELEDSSFDLDSFLRKSFSIRFGRGLEKAVTLGTDSAGTTLPNQATGGLVGVATSGTVTASLAAGIGWDDLTTAYGNLDPAYINPKTAWTFNANTRSVLLGMKDGFGRPFWTPDPSADGPFTKLLGYDVVLNQAMANIGAANAKPILLGDLEQAYMLRTDGAPSILRLNERYADTLEVGFYLYSRIGGVSLNAGISPLVYIQQAAN